MHQLRLGELSYDPQDAQFRLRAAERAIRRHGWNRDAVFRDGTTALVARRQHYACLGLFNLGPRDGSLAASEPATDHGDAADPENSSF